MILGVLALAGVGVWAIGLITAPKVAWSGLLVAAMYAVSITLGAALLSAINIVTAARWWLPLTELNRRVSSQLPVAVGAIVLVMLFGMDIYPWMNHELMESSHLLHEKVVWLNRTFVLIRAGIIITVWLVLVRALNERVTAALDNPNDETRGKMAVVGAIFLVLFAMTISVASWDWTMSLEPEYFSTMAGVYSFAGVFIGGISGVTLLALGLSEAGMIEISEDHRHDLGKLVFAFSFFWAYIWFCQYMLTWYANIPEEAGYFTKRIAGGWGGLFITNAVVNFGLPFFLLLSAKAKKNKKILFAVVVLVLLGRWIDTWLMVAPSVEPGPTVPLYALAATLGLLAIMGLLDLWPKKSADEPQLIPVQEEAPPEIPAVAL